MGKKGIIWLTFSIYLGLLLLAPIEVTAVDGGSGDPEGAHNQILPGLKDALCKRCHFVKSGNAPKIWKDVPLGAETIKDTKGVRTICQSCHYPGNAVNAISGFSLGVHPTGGHEYSYSNVFLDKTNSGQGEDHVMHDWADIDPVTGRLPEGLNPAFPTKKADKWGYPRQKGDTENKGFYCISCHDPHKQPEEKTDGTGDYLRLKEGGNLGASGDRTIFCLQCHQNIPEKPQHGVKLGCQRCHHPHDSIIRIEDDPILGQWILLVPIRKTNFRALPNVPSFGSQENEIDLDMSSTCYGCHNPSRPADFSKLGAAIIFGDDTDTPKEHHPMGSQAMIKGMIHADEVMFPSPEGQLTCISCHDGFHEGKNPYFLRQDFTEDAAGFCSVCHNEKTSEDLGPAKGQGHRQIFGKSPNGRGDCMFCHFIHDGRDCGTESTPAIEALIRVQPMNLAWAKKGDIQSTEDYEDICYGCHGDIIYMKGSGYEGAMLQPDKFASHPFSGAPHLVKPREGFLISDGQRSETINDYGVPSGEIFCGSCHNVHKASNKPYLRVDDSPYLGQGFCEGCHTECPAEGRSSHPVGMPPNMDKTVAKFPDTLYGGGSGDPRGITRGNEPDGETLCLTCHNVHAASTDHQGNLTDKTAIRSQNGKHGHLLCADNFSSEDGSDLCRSCHKPFEGICGSRHDFSGIDLGEISSKGVCSACHTPHKTKDKVLLWPRSLTEERGKLSQKDKPDYVPGITIFCYDCHEDISSLDNDPPSSAFFKPPQDIAFSDGPGSSSMVGYYDTIPPGDTQPPSDGSPTGGHYIQTAHISRFRHGIETGDKLPCDLCHNPHGGNNNQVFLVNPLGVNTTDNLEASRHTRNGTGTGREICASCHGYAETDALIGIPLKIYDFTIVRTSGGRAEHKKNSGAPCTNCHRHNRIVPVQNQAHLVHLISSRVSEQDGSNLIRTKSMDGASRGLGVDSCSICHLPELTYEIGELKFSDDQPLNRTNVCQSCHSEGGSYNGVSDPSIGAKFNWRSSPYNSNGTLKLGKEKWCAGCHDEKPSTIWWPGLDRTIVAPNICGEKEYTASQDQGYGFYESGHGLAPYFKYMDSERRGAGLLCTDCHDPDLPHVMSKRYDAEAGNYQSGYRLRSINGKEPMIIPRLRDEYWPGDFNLCYSCHPEKSIIGLGFGYRSYTTNHNPFFLVDNPETGFKNIDLQGLNRHNTTLGPTFDFINYYPSNSHWNHLALPNALVTLSVPTGGGRTRISSCIDSKCHSKIVWDSDRDGFLDSRPSCTTCHNPHGTRYPSMTRNDIAITHDQPGQDWRYGYINSRNYGLFGNEGEDLYCGECHAKLMRFGESNYKYYRNPWVDADEIAPKAPE
ncbi:hypothetical protein JXL19_07970 [bacterium]|nr:hypothetical protein [bacterium]